jgi:hypothetical protein
MPLAKKKRLFLAVGEAFLSEDSEAPLSLANQALWNDLLATFTSLKAGLQVHDFAVRVQNGTSQNGTLKNGTFHNGT